MPYQIMRWKCDYCEKHYAHKGSAVKHEKKCFYNPVNRSCATCANAFLFDVAKDSYCTVTKESIFKKAIKNCPHWFKLDLPY